ncbi:hypothetical protein KSS87_020939 [Heliosperma pusillum]|nr:hypothetical protein KSS87_020939 [Heliosperma pusillum]
MRPTLPFSLPLSLQTKSHFFFLSSLFHVNSSKLSNSATSFTLIMLMLNFIRVFNYQFWGFLNSYAHFLCAI